MWRFLHLSYCDVLDATPPQRVKTICRKAIDRRA
jgi:hypothetical protein